MKKLLGVFVMTFIYYKVIYFCSISIYLDSRKVKTILLQCCYCPVSGWQLRCSLFFTSRDCRVISHTLHELLEKERFSSILLILESSAIHWITCFQVSSYLLWFFEYCECWLLCISRVMCHTRRKQRLEKQFLRNSVFKEWGQILITRFLDNFW